MSIKEIKEFLNRSYMLEKRINSKLEQITVLRSLALKVNSVFSDMPPNSTKNMKVMEDTLCKIIDLESNVFADLMLLMNVKEEVSNFIKSIENKEYQLILELRYLCNKSWDNIAEVMNFSIQNIFKIHFKALKFLLKLKN